MRVRQENGFSLVTVLSVTLLATLWLTASTANLLAVYRSASVSKFSAEIVSYADSATAYVVQALNDPSQRSTFDTSNSRTSLFDGSKWGASTEIKVTTTVIASAPTIYSFLFDGTSSNSTTSQYSASQSLNTWRIVTTTVNYAGLSKTVQVVLGPSRLQAEARNGFATLPFGSSTGTTPFFNSAILSTGNMQLGSGFSSSGEDSSNNNAPVLASDAKHSPLGGDVVSYAPITLTGSNISIGGSISALSVDNSNPSVTTQSQSTTVINRYVNASGTVVGLNDGSGNGPVNVLGLSNATLLPTQSQAMQLGQDATAAQTAAQVMPSPLAPSSVTVFPQQASVKGGDYSTDQLAVPSGSNLSVSGTSNPARVYLNDSSGSGNGEFSSGGAFTANGTSTGVVAQINGSVNTNGLPANFQLFYGGTGIIDLRGATVNGTIYAPNAFVYMSNTSIYGAIVAGHVSGGPPSSNGVMPSAINVSVVYDTSLSNPSALKNQNALGLLTDPTSIRNAYAGTNIVNVIPFQVRYYSEQASLH